MAATILGFQFLASAAAGSESTPVSLTAIVIGLGVVAGVILIAVRVAHKKGGG